MPERFPIPASSESTTGRAVGATERETAVVGHHRSAATGHLPLTVMSESTSGYLTPDEITKANFETKRRGFDPEAVKRHLASTAATVHGLLAERNSLAEQIATLEERLREAQASPVPQAELDEDALTERLGQDAARVLAEARAAAADRIAEAEVQADDIRAAAEEVFAERSIAADEEANRIRERAEETVHDRTLEAEKSAEQIRARAEADAETARAAVAGERQSADADAARLVREAELTRRQILEDLARRRSAARRQIEQLRAGRERLLASHEMVRRALDDISEELTISMSEARAAAETAGHSVSDTTIEELEAEIETARLTGLLDTGPLPVVTPTAAPFNHEVDDSHDDDGPPEEEPTPDAVAPSDAVASSEAVPEPETVEASEPESESEPEVPSVVPQPVADSTADASSGLAEVVQLDRARNDVDTATHPATGRDASSSRSSARTSEATAEDGDVVPGTEDGSEGDAPRQAPKLEAVASPPEIPSPDVEQPDTDEGTGEAKVADEPGDDDSVGDLFASLRSTTPSPAAKASSPKKSSAKKKASPKKTSAKKKAGPKQTSAKATKSTGSQASNDAAAEDDVDSSEMARRLKRVLADEQSRAMSQLKSASTMPSLDELLGDVSAHRAGYWSEVTTHIDNVTDSDEQLKKPVDELIESIRRRVGDALVDAGDDSETAVSSLRSVYREVKIQRISICADQVCRMATGRSADRS